LEGGIVGEKEKVADSMSFGDLLPVARGRRKNF